MIGKAVLVSQDAVVCRLDVFGFVRRLADQDCVENNSHGPNIYFKGVPTLSFVTLNDFWCNIVGRPANRFPLFIPIFHSRCQTKITHFYVQVLIQKQIAKFEITVDDRMSVHVPNSLRKLPKKKSSLWLRQSLPSFNHLIQTLIMAKF